MDRHTGHFAVVRFDCIHYLLCWMHRLGDKNGKRLKKIPKKGWEIRKNGVWFFKVLSRPKLVKKMQRIQLCGLFLCWMHRLGDKNGKRLIKILKKGWEIRKNGVWFFEVSSIP